MRIEGAVDRLLDAMLFVGEAPLVGRVRGSSSFVDEFPARGPADALGRSLRDFDLERRLFRHPLSFLIYSDAFQALPAPALDAFHRRLDRILSGDPDETYGHLTEEDRRAIRKILDETLPAASRAQGPSLDRDT